jgi:hypothetical protein
MGANRVEPGATASAAAAKQMCESASAGKLHIAGMEIGNPFL